MYGLDAGDLTVGKEQKGGVIHVLQTICFAAMHTVLIENFRPHISNKSSRLGPSRSMTRMLWSPS
jgi:hypothetical protein